MTMPYCSSRKREARNRGGEEEAYVSRTQDDVDVAEEERRATGASAGTSEGGE